MNIELKKRPVWYVNMALGMQESYDLHRALESMDRGEVLQEMFMQLEKALGKTPK